MGAPSINYDLQVTLVPNEDGSFNYTVTGDKDGFPACELWVTDLTNNKAFLILHTNTAEAGKSPLSLFPPKEENYKLAGSSKSLKSIDKLEFKDTVNTPQAEESQPSSDSKNTK